YALGWASCPSGPAAACTDESASGPLLTTSAGMSGPGGPDVYDLPAVGSASPQLVMALSAWQGTTIGYLACGIRPMYLADLSFGPNGGGPPGAARPPPPPAVPPAPQPHGAPPRQPDLSGRPDARARILAGRLRRRHLQLRRRPVLRLHPPSCPPQTRPRGGR